jgi:aminopeptidase N
MGPRSFEKATFESCCESYLGLMKIYSSQGFRMKKSGVCLLIAALAFSMSAFAQRLPGTAVPSHYALKVQPDFQTDKFAGDEVIDVRLEKPTNSVTLNSLEIVFDSVTITAGGKTQNATVNVEPEKEMATLTVPEQLATGEAQIKIRYTGTLSDKLSGFYLSKANGRKYAVTQFEATDARRAFPSFDEPDYKATFDITVVAPEEDMVISNGKVVSDTKGPEPGVHTVKFTTTPKMSTYLVAFLVGQFDCVSGAADEIPVRVCAPPGKQQLGEYALGWAENILKFYNHYYSIKYPYGKLDLIAIPDFEAGAMENTAAITFRDDDLLLDPKTATIDHQKGVASVIAHEMAHQWFGDLVTMKWWNDIWLNEGFATWMETKPLAALKPEWGMSQDDEASAIQAMRIDSLKSTRAIRTNAETPAQINELFDAIAYNKSAAVLGMVEAYVGPESFRKGVNAYLQAHAYGNATAEDFWTKVAQVTGKPVDRIMKSYVDQPGIPIVSMAGGCVNGEAALNQRRFYLDEPQRPPVAEAWTIPVCTKGAGAQEGTCDLLSKPSEKVKVNACSEKLNENAGAEGYYRSGYTPEQTAALAKVIEKAFTPAERLSILANEWALARAGDHQIRGYLELAQGLQTDRTHGVWDDIAGSLRFLDGNMVNDADHQAYEQWVREFATPVMQQVGWTARPGDDYETQKVRADAFLVLGYVGRDARAAEEARAIVQQYIKDPASTDPMLSEPAFTIAASQGDVKLYNEILEAMLKAKSPDVYYRYMNALAQFTDPALVRRTLELAMSPQIRTQDMPIMLLRLMANPAARQETWNFVRTNWPQVSKRASMWGSALVVRGTASFCDARMRGEVQQFFSEHQIPQAERTFKQSLEEIGNCVDFKSAQQSNLAAWLTGSSAARGE